MSVEAPVSIGSAIGSVATGVGKAGVSLDAMFGPKMGPVMPEGGSFMGAKNFGTLDLIGGTRQPFSPAGGEILFQAKPESTVTSVESFLAQARMPQIEPMSMPEIAPFADPKTPPLEFVMPQIEPSVLSWAMPMAEPAVEAQPKLQPAIQTESRVSVQPAAAPTPAVLPQPVQEEQKEKEEVITREEIIENTELKDVVDEPVLSTRIEEFSYAAELAGAETEEIDGKKIVEKVGSETAKSRSGI